MVPCRPKRSHLLPHFHQMLSRQACAHCCVAKHFIQCQCGLTEPRHALCQLQENSQGHGENDQGRPETIWFMPVAPPQLHKVQELASTTFGVPLTPAQLRARNLPVQDNQLARLGHACPFTSSGSSGHAAGAPGLCPTHPDRDLTETVL